MSFRSLPGALTWGLALAIFAAGGTALRAQAHFMTPPPAVSAQRPEEPAPAEARVPYTLMQYSIGNPTATEQYMLQVLNQARANTTVDVNELANSTDIYVQGAIKFFAPNGNTTVLLTALKEQFLATIPHSLPPLAFNGELLESSLLHSEDMSINDFQGHDNSANVTNVNPGLTPNGTFTTRINFVNYNYENVAENVFAYGQSPYEVHASFEIDWGSDTEGAVDGIQVPPGHRYNNHDLSTDGSPPYAPTAVVPGYKEIGIGITSGLGNGNGTVSGPMVVTYDLGVQQNSTPFITGVVYKDANLNGNYDIGEGVGNVMVTVNGASYYAVTVGSGGYAVPVPGNGTYQVTFSGGGLANYSYNATVINNENVEVDYRTVPKVTKPVISKQPAATKVLLKANATFKITATGLQLTYQWYFKTKAVKNGTKYAGVTTATLTVKKVAKTDASTYYCVVANKAGKVTSKKVALTIK
jgi:uncharacterized protein YkwD